MFIKGGELKKKFLTIVITTIVVITFLCILSGFRIYNMQISLISTGIKEEATRIERSVSYTFDYTEYIIEHINKQINNNSDDTNYIQNILRNYNGSEETKSIFASSLFAWVDKDLQLTVTNNLGILTKSFDYSKSEYWNSVKNNPTKFHIGNPVGGSISGQWVIPAALGVEDKDGNFAGAVVMGIDIGLINEKLERSVRSSSASFVLIDKRTKEIVLNSSNDKYISKNFDPIGYIYDIDFASNPNGNLSTYNIFDNNKPQSYYQSFTNYPYTIVVNYDPHRITQKLISILLPQAFIFCSIIFALAILLYLIHYNILSPIVILSKFADSLTSEESVHRSLNPKQMSYEINNLYNHLLCIELYISNEKHINKQLNETKEHLKDALGKTELMNNEIKQINSSLEAKVQDRTNKLQKALAAKTEFLNNISHEVRTPIQGVTALSQGLVEHWNEFSESKRLELAGQVAQNAKRLFTLVNNLLDLSKFTASKMIFEKKLADLVLLIEDMIDECNSLYLNGNNAIRIEFNKGDFSSALVIMDKDRMIQVLRNLFANAIKFTQSGVIKVELAEQQLELEDKSLISGLLFSIQDDGIGIPNSELKTIFEPFTQSSRTKTTAGGTGLGLAIVREVINGHNGKIWAENNYNKGAKFSFIIPFIQQEQHNILNFSLAGRSIDKINCSPPRKNSKANILIIDDEESCLMSMEILLHGCNYNLITIDNAKEAIDYLKSSHNQVDLILLDLMMPDMYGLNLLLEIKKLAHIQNVPVILQSGISDEAEIKKAYSLGIIDFIKKPYQKDKILSSINKIFKIAA